MCLFDGTTCCITGELVFFEAIDGLVIAYKPASGRQNAAIPRRVGGTGRRRRGQHRSAAAQLLQGFVEDFTRRRVLDELDKRFDGGGVLNALRSGIVGPPVRSVDFVRGHTCINGAMH